MLFFDKLKIVLFFIFSFACSHYGAAQLVVNEFSQGPSGNKEYIELVVFGQASCLDTCSDVRGWIFDDNNGWYGSSAISPGCYRLKDDPNWECVPFGSIIVVYNDADKNPNLPPDDPTDANNDGVYVLPITSPYLELHATLPSGSSQTFPSTGFGPSTTWTNMALNNSSDAVQTVDPQSLTTAYHAVGYGSSMNAPVQINASGSQKVYYLTNDQYNLSAGWTSGSVPANETPGAPNSPANATWLNSMKVSSGGTSSNDTVDVSLCGVDSYFFNGKYISATGYYTATFTSEGGCDSIVTINLLVTQPPVAPTVTPPVMLCHEANSSPLSATGSNLLWYETAVGGIGSTLAPVPSTNVVGRKVYYVSQTINGCEGVRDSIVVITNDIPLPPFADTLIVMCGYDQAIKLNMPGQNLKWYPSPFGGSGQTDVPVIQPDPAGMRVEWFVGQSLGACESKRSKIEIQVNLLTADFELSSDTLCLGDTLLTKNLSSGNDYLNIWDFGDGFTYIHPDHYYIYKTTGVYPVTLVVQNKDLCLDTLQKTVTVFSPPSIDVMMDKQVLCEGEKISFECKVGDFGSTYDFDFGDNRNYKLYNEDLTEENTASFSHSYEKSGVYYLTFNGSSLGCGNSSWNDSVVVHPAPKVYLGSDTSLCLGGAPIVLGNHYPVLPGEKYLWQFKDTTHTYVVKHHGEITLKVSNQHCATIGSVEVKKDCYIDIPNAFTPNNDGYNDYFLPRKLLSKGAVQFEMKIMNRWSQLIYETYQLDGLGWDGKFNDQEQPMGVYLYLIRIVFKNGQEEIYKGNVTLIR